MMMGLCVMPISRVLLCSCVRKLVLITFCAVLLRGTVRIMILVAGSRLGRLAMVRILGCVSWFMSVILYLNGRRCLVTVCVIFLVLITIICWLVSEAKALRT